ncbi:MAG: aminotransferase class V-fold PLP-dependent enzyme [Christensenellaceae bacterium]|nr:aminotransferase class V-fold PLP-dependent enzyme [Christensenellaceae bacterium]
MCKDIYLDNAATTRFKPRKATNAVIKTFKSSANPGRSSHSSAISLALIIEETRALISKHFGFSNVVFTKNCTEALNLAIFGSNLNGEVITSVFEHNSILRPLKKLESEKKIKIRFVKPASNEITVDEVIQILNSKTSAIILSEMSNVTGAIHEIEKIAKLAKENNVISIIDTAQSLGHLYTLYENVNILCASGHKGLHGPQGTGFLAFNESTRLNPLLYGGTGTMSISIEQPTSMIEGLESGTLNTLGIAGLKEGIEWTMSHIEAVRKHIHELSYILISNLRNISGITIYSDNLSGVISFNIGELASTFVSDILSKKYNISVRSGLHCAPLAHRHLGTLKQGTVRASIGWNNSINDIEKLISAIKSIKYSKQSNV